MLKKVVLVGSVVKSYIGHLISQIRSAVKELCGMFDQPFNLN